MRNLQIISLVLLAAAIGATSYGQGFEYGKPSELKGLKKIFVEAGEDMTARDDIIAVIEKANPQGIELLDSSDGAEVVLRFEGSTKPSADGSVLLKAGTGRVFISGKSSQRARLIMSINAQRDVLHMSKPSTQIAKAFLAAYKKANKLK